MPLNHAVIPLSNDINVGQIKAAIANAQSQGIEWILCLDEDEKLRADIFTRAAPALRIHDVVWGAVSLFNQDKEIDHVIRISRLACQSPEEFFHLALTWWIGKSFFIKTNIAAQTLPPETSQPWFIHWLVDLWCHQNCHKLAQPLTSRETPPPHLKDHEKTVLLNHLDTNPIFRTVHLSTHDTPQKIKLPYTGRNPVIEREHTKGLFYEEDELWYLATRIPPQSTIIDVGANTGNHTVFFAVAMHAKTVIPIEPNPQSFAALKHAISINKIDNVDMKKLGIGVGAQAGSFRLVHSQGGGLGATRLSHDPQGSVNVLPLDELITDSTAPIDFLKIDVESMEMDVLQGAENLIAKNRPQIFIEIADENIEAFLAWIDCHAYHIEKIFSDKTHANYFLSPDSKTSCEGVS